MVKRSRGFLSGRTRQLRSGRKLTVSDQVREYKVGSNVVIALQPRRDGMVAPRYNGRHGKILDKQGEAYIVSVKDGNATKKLVISSIHLKEAA
ncbi:50S ribosomal protein L21e [Candidatus Micrarchaeota archaeon]|nr:50S ribosomal protein L21e [Candidatus Micrarchaeota archaeon]